MVRCIIKKEVPQLIFSGSKLMLEQGSSSNNKSLSQVNLYYEVKGVLGHDEQDRLQTGLLQATVGCIF